MRFWTIVVFVALLWAAPSAGAAGPPHPSPPDKGVLDITVEWVFPERGGAEYGCRYWRGRAGISQLFVLPGVGEGRV